MSVQPVRHRQSDIDRSVRKLLETVSLGGKAKFIQRSKSYSACHGADNDAIKHCAAAR